MSILEDSIKTRMFRLGISRQQLAAFSHIREQILFPGLNTRVLTSLELLSIDQSLSAIERLVKVLEPFPISLSDTRKIKFLLEKLQVGDVARALTPFMAVLAEEWRTVDAQVADRF